MNKAYRLALLCGLIPLLLGIFIFLLWLITSWDWLMPVGIVSLYGGIACFLVGAIALARFCWLAFRTPELPRQRLWLCTIGCASLLLLNFPMAGGITIAAIALETRYTVVVHNTSQQRLDDVRVSGGGCNEFYGSVAPGGVVQRSFWIRNDGELLFHAVSSTTTYVETIAGYVTHNIGGHMTVNVNPDGTISVINENG